MDWDAIEEIEVQGEGVTSVWTPDVHVDVPMPAGNVSVVLFRSARYHMKEGGPVARSTFSSRTGSSRAT